MPVKSETMPRCDLLMQAVKAKMDRDGVTADQLARKLDFSYYLVKPWLGGSAFPKGENALVLLEWVTGKKVTQILGRVPL